MDGSSAPRPVWLTDAAHRLLGRYGVAAVAGVWLVTRLAILAYSTSADPTARASLFAQVGPWFGGDITHYFEWSGAWLSGQVPYRDLAIQYPPGAVVLFTIPRLFATTLDGYAVAFGLELMACEGLALVLAWRLAALIITGREGARDAETRTAQVLASLAYLALGALLGRLLVRRFDTAVGLLVIAFVYGVLSGRRVLWAELALALGTWTKLTPAALVPLYLVMLHRREAGDAPFWRWLVTKGWLPAARIVVFVGALVAPFAWMARGALLQILRFQADRGVHLESLPGSLLVFVQSLHDVGVTAREAHGAVEVFHPLARVLTIASDLAVVAAVLLIAIVCARRLRAAGDPADERTLFAAATAATLFAVMGMSKLFSPQYVLWAAVLLPLTQVRGVSRRFALAATAVYALTGYLYLFDYTNLTSMSRLPAAMLLARNVALLGVVWHLAARTGQRERAPLRDERRARVAAAVIAALVAAWIVLTNLTPLHEGELWSDLHIGREILTRHVFPRTDILTATGDGAPVALHGWLSGVSFYAILRVARAWTLCLLQPAVAAGCALLLVLSLGREARRSAAVVPCLLLAVHVIASRTDVRHQMFSPLALAALGFALERWRRSGRLRDLAWLVPVQVLWSNLNGGAVAAPLLVAFLAVIVGVGARRGGGSFADDARALRGRDALALAGTAAALLLATLCNPYGLSRALVVPGWEDGDGQWTLAPAVLHEYPTWSCGALAAALWLALALRWRGRRPVLDVAIAAFATALSLRAARFLPYVAILGFPIVVRSARDLAGALLTEPAPRRWLGLELGLALALVAIGAVDGYSFDAWSSRPLGLGVAKQLPFEEVQLVKQSGLAGAVFNDRAAGGLIAFNLAPHVLPVIDARHDAAGTERWAEYQRARANRDEFLAYLDRHDVRFVLLHVEPANLPLLRTLGDHPGWSLKSGNTRYGLYVRNAQRGQ